MWHCGKSVSRSRGRALKILAVLLLSAGAAIGAPVKKPERARVIQIVAQIQRADYEGDRAALQRLYEGLNPYVGDKEISSRIHYWRGFALWRKALNGFNDSVDPQELEQELKQAVEEFDKSAAADAGFVDAKIAAVSCLSNLMFLNQKNPARIQELLARVVPMTKEAQAAAPDNPRLMWVVGANRWYISPEHGGGQDKAIETYQKGLELARKQKGGTSDALDPAWGEPELLMNLAWSNAHKTVPDLEKAERYAQAAVEEVPYWHYVRDILVPQIRDSKTKKNNQ